MNYQKVFKCFLTCLMVLLLQPVIAESDDKTKTVDDLFQYLVDEWANKIEYTSLEGCSVYNDFLISLFLSHGAEPNYIEATQSFCAKLIASEDDWIHLPEYWQLRAQLERDNDLEWIEDMIPVMGEPFANKPYGKHNSDLLQKSFDIDPSNADVRWYLGRLEHEKNFPVSPKFNEPIDTEYERNYYTSKIDYNAGASSLDPKNAYFSLNEAAYHHLMGDADAAIDAIKRAGECDYFNPPRLFPSSYAIKHINAFESGYRPFGNLTPGGKFYLYKIFYDYNDQVPNYIRIKNMYKEIIADSHSKDDWRETLNILHHTACVLGKSESYDLFLNWVAEILVQFCLKEAYIQAKEIGDENLQFAVIAALGKTAISRNVSRKRMGDASDSADRYLVSIYVDYINRSLAKIYLKEANVAVASFTESVFLPPKLEMLNRWRAHKKIIKPVFEELETFDYTKPDEWYETWLEKTFPYLYESEE